MRQLDRVLVVAAFLLCLVPAPAPAGSADAILGVYLNDDRNAKIEIFKEGLKYFGKIIWHNVPRKDEHNPDPALRGRDVEGLVFLRDFKYDAGENEWTGGKVYAPDNGKTYSGYLWLEKGLLKMRGYVGISLFGRTAVFTPVAE